MNFHETYLKYICEDKNSDAHKGILKMIKSEYLRSKERERRRYEKNLETERRKKDLKKRADYNKQLDNL